jgi:hypothetical protein
MRKIFALLALVVGLAQAATTVPPQLISPSGSTAGQAIVSNGPGSAPSWSTVTAGGLTPITGNSVYANFTGTSAAPIANAMPSCSTANSALKYTSGTGLSCGTTFALTSGNLAQFASTTSAQLLGVLSDETGSGAVVFGTSPTIASPTLSGTVAGAHSYSGALSFTSTITPSQTSGIVGTTTNNNANAGSIGEYVTATGAGVALTNNVPANGTSISLTAGDWDVDGLGMVDSSGGSVVGGVLFSLSTTSATLSTPRTALLASLVTNGSAYLPCPTVRVSVASTTTVYLVVQASFASGSATGNGIIRARRVR